MKNKLSFILGCIVGTIIAKLIILGIIHIIHCI